MGNALNITGAAVSAIESGKTVPGRWTLVEAIRALTSTDGVGGITGQDWGLKP